MKKFIMILGVGILLLMYSIGIKSIERDNKARSEQSYEIVSDGKIVESSADNEIQIIEVFVEMLSVGMTIMGLLYWSKIIQFFYNGRPYNGIKKK